MFSLWDFVLVGYQYKALGPFYFCLGKIQTLAVPTSSRGGLNNFNTCKPKQQGLANSLSAVITALISFTWLGQTRLSNENEQAMAVSEE